MASARTVIVAGAGIGGLATALALKRNGFRVVVLEQSERLEETGAGIQLSPNAARILIDLGLGDRLRPHVVAPRAVRVLTAKNGREITRIPLGDEAAQRYGAPYWIIHRGDLQTVLQAAVAPELDISLKLGMRMEDFATHPHGVTVQYRGAWRSGTSAWSEHGDALIAADGLWSIARTRLGFREPPRFSGRTAWRALVPASDVPPEYRAPLIHLWLGPDAHLVHYPVKAGAVINIVVITAGDWQAQSSTGQSWSEPASRDDLLPRLTSARWAPQARAIVALPDAWLKWALFDRRPLLNWSQGAAALLGDAAHPMLPFLAQGGAMAIEDAAVAAQCLGRMPDHPANALKIYTAIRRGRTRRVQRQAARNGQHYHLKGVSAMVRNAAMSVMGGQHLLSRYDWLYDWRPPAALSIS